MAKSRTSPRKGTNRKPVRSKRPARPARRRSGGFVGRDPSPILDRYPPKDPTLSPRGPASTTPPVSAAAPVAAALAAPPPGPPAPTGPLLSLERPFSVDEFAGQLGATSLEVTVPRDDLAEVLRRVCEFMGFGIYVYELRVRPAPSDSLKSFIVTLQRVDFRAERHGWIPFEERGRSDSPFGPEGQR